MYYDGQILTAEEHLDFADWANQNQDQYESEYIPQDKTYIVRKIIVQEPTIDEKAQARIAELKQLLADTDYAIIKIAEGSATQEEYADLIAQRKAWREEINQLGV